MSESPHFRDSARAAVAMRVEYQEESASGVGHARSAKTRDMSARGAFIETLRLPEIGARVRVAIYSPTAWEPLSLAGAVAWHQSGAPPGVRGFGVHFDGLTPGQARAIRQLLSASEFE